MKFSSEFVFLYVINKAGNYTQLEMEQIKLQSNEIISSYLNKTTENAPHRFGYQTKKNQSICYKMHASIHFLLVIWQLSKITRYSSVAVDKVECLSNSQKICKILLYIMAFLALISIYLCHLDNLLRLLFTCLWLQMIVTVKSLGKKTASHDRSFIHFIIRIVESYFAQFPLGRS